MHKYKELLLCKQSVSAKADFLVFLIYFSHIEFAIEVNQLRNITPSALFLPTVKRVGDVYITYSVSKCGNSYAIAVSSSVLSEGDAFVEDIAQDYAKAERIKDWLAENLVSPLHVLDVFDDISADICI